jgi:hypothetical protein
VGGDAQVAGGDGDDVDAGVGFGGVLGEVSGAGFGDATMLDVADGFEGGGGRGGATPGANLDDAENTLGIARDEVDLAARAAAVGLQDRVAAVFQIDGCDGLAGAPSTCLGSAIRRRAASDAERQGQGAQGGAVACTDGGEAIAMLGAGTARAQGGEVAGRSVALIVVEAVAAVGSVEGLHPSVAGDFCDDGGGGDARANGVAANDGLVSAVKAVAVAAVDEDVVGGGIVASGEVGEGAAHGEAGGLKDSDAVDLVHANPADAPGGNAVLDSGGDVAAGGRAELLAVTHAAEPSGPGVGVERDGAGDDGTGEGAAADFVDTGDAGDAAVPKFEFTASGRALGSASVSPGIRRVAGGRGSYRSHIDKPHSSLIRRG